MRIRIILMVMINVIMMDMTILCESSHDHIALTIFI
jgi:hypothetical protein